MEQPQRRRLVFVIRKILLLIGCRFLDRCLCPGDIIRRQQRDHTEAPRSKIISGDGAGDISPL